MGKRYDYVETTRERLVEIVEMQRQVIAAKNRVISFKTGMISDLHFQVRSLKVQLDDEQTFAKRWLDATPNPQIQRDRHRVERHRDSGRDGVAGDDPGCESA